MSSELIEGLAARRWLLIAAALPLSVVALALGGLLFAVDFQTARLAWDQLADVLEFTLLQALYSSTLSLMLAIPLALTLNRRRWPALEMICNLAMVLPVLVTILGIAAVHGNSGWLLSAARAVGIDTRSWLYGWGGILIAHAFFNVPLAARILRQPLSALPLESWRIARQLAMTPWQRWRHLEWPAIRPALSDAATIVFLACFTSFAVVLVFGRAPFNATFEVAIYQAVRLDFDLAAAALLALMQLAVLALMLPLFRPSLIIDGANQGLQHRHRAAAWMRADRLFDLVVVLIVSVLLALPIVAVVVDAANPSAWFKVLSAQETVRAVVTSIALGLASALLALLLTLALLAATDAAGRGLHAVLGVALLAYAVPNLLLGTGLFIALRDFAGSSLTAVIAVIVVSALKVLPFTVNALIARTLAERQRWYRLCRNLDMPVAARLRLVYGPLLRQPLRWTTALAFCFTLGDFSVIALFGSPGFSPLPYLLYQKYASYRFDEAAVLAVLLMALVGVAFALVRVREERHGT
ncbi:ABC transporter permease subunit [Gammaproteobacteria bacterium]|nr:ABC transporter permease subunit [Gammaproteobacteria bacterium]